MLRVHSIIVFLFGMVFLSPFYFGVNDAPIFYLQIIAILVFTPGIRIYFGEINIIDQCFMVYVTWVLISFLLNIPLLWIQNGSETFANQFISLLNAFLLIMPYLMGKSYFRAVEDINVFIYSSVITFTVIVVYCLFFYIININDLYIARQTIGQRFPLMLTFIGWSVCSLGFWRSTNRSLLIGLWLISTLMVALSLTRASYIQWFFSCTIFLLLNLYRSRGRISIIIKIVRSLLIVAVIFAAGIIFMIVKSDMQSSVLVDRVEQIITPTATIEKDESANIRFEIWKKLISKILESPVHLLIGYGQLGPSYVGESFVSLSGVTISKYAAHNQYLDTLIRTGFIGLVIEIVFYAVVIIVPFLKRPSDNKYGDFFIAHSIGLMGVAFYAFFHETLRWQMFGFYFWLYAGMLSSQISCDASHRKKWLLS